MFLRKLNKLTSWSIFNNIAKNLKNAQFEFEAVIPKNFNRNLSIYSNCAILDKNNFLLKRSYCSASDDRDDNELETVEDLYEHDLDTDSSKFSLKSLLYPEQSKDELFNSLNETTNPKEILDHFNQNKEFYSAQTTTQAVILLWDYCRTNMPMKDIELHKNKRFEELLIKLNDLIIDMNPDEVTCCLLYLTKLGVDHGHLTIRNLLLRSLDIICDINTTVPLSALSRLSVAIVRSNNYSTALLCKNIIPHVLYHIENCTTPKEIRLITICLQSANVLATKEILEIYSDKIKKLIDMKAFNSESSKSILKIVSFLCIPMWSHIYYKIIRDLLLILTNSIEQMQSRELELAIKIFQSQLEPASFVPKLLVAAEKLYDKNPEILAGTVQLNQLNKKNQFIEIAKNMILNTIKMENASEHLPALFKILRSLKISDMKLCNLYWSKVLNEIQINPKEREDYRLIRHLHRYMHFNNNLGGTYRHYEFERIISTILMKECTDGLAGIIPSKFSRFASFIIAYSHDTAGKSNISNYIVKKIESMEKQFTIFDCVQLSRGFQIALIMQYRNSYFPSCEITSPLNRIENVLQNCAVRHLENENLNLSELNFIIRSFNNRKASHKTPLYQKAINLYKKPLSSLNSRTIRDITFNLNSSNYLIPEILTNIFNYIIENRDYILGDTVEKIINCAYNLGYVPESNEGLYWAAEIIKRDFNYMTSLSIVQSCLALCYYKVMPEDLIAKIFDPEFIQRVEDEIQTCYSKQTYPGKVLNQVMQLNRAICLDYPESQIPWFQQNYIEAQMSKKRIGYSKFHKDIENLLLSVVKSKEYLKCNHVTPYGYRIDFVLHFDKNFKIIKPLQEITLLERITKVAILVLKVDSFCSNETDKMKGSEHLRMRHLEMLGYQVIHINLKDWNALHMNVPGAKVNYLKNLLRISDNSS